MTQRYTSNLSDAEWSLEFRLSTKSGVHRQCAVCYTDFWEIVKSYAKYFLLELNLVVHQINVG
jgi:hypothetical protein